MQTMRLSLIGWRHGMRKSARCFPIKTMDIERVNAIGTLLADLTARTTALRGYL